MYSRDHNVGTQLALAAAPRFTELAHSVHGDQAGKESFLEAPPTKAGFSFVGLVQGIICGLLLWVFDWLVGKCREQLDSK